jgi:hypothetical protein
VNNIARLGLISIVDTVDVEFTVVTATLTNMRVSTSSSRTNVYNGPAG